jgi:pimeloyl-ACP methyl ester carboxylesterase
MREERGSGMAEFILVHGGQHGAWCWDLLRPDLEKLGHKTHAMDMPVDQAGVHIDGYVQAVHAAIAGKAADGAYLVGHSMGGLIVPRVAAERPRDRIIFLCAGFAHTSAAEQQENMAAIDGDLFNRSLVMDSQGRVTMSRENATNAFYHDVPADLVDWAYGKLRPQWVEGYANVPPIAPYAERVAGIVACSDDHIVLPEPHAKLARRRFGKEPRFLPGSHSPFLSRPADLARVFDEIVRADRR